MVAMVTKVLSPSEVERGFLRIPKKDRAELLGENSAPFDTKLNDSLAKVDKFGQIWSDYLKRYPVDTKVSISKNNVGFRIVAIGQTSIIPQVEGASVVLPKTEIDEKMVCKRQAEVEENELNAQPLRNDAVLADSKPYFHTGAVYIFNEDLLRTEAIREDSIDLIVTSPPYCVAVNYENYDDGIPYNEYLSFSRNWLRKCRNLVKNDGRLCLNIPLDKNKGGQQSVYADLTKIAKEEGWKYQSTIIWNEQNISKRTAWGSWLSASAPFVIAPVEVIVVLYKEFWGKQKKGKSDIVKSDFIEWTNGVWNFNGESKRRVGHPAPFPIELPKRCIRLFSYVGDVVLDPFLGSGTTLLACMETNRAGIGIEINKNYCDLAEKRLMKGACQKKL